MRELHECRGGRVGEAVIGQLDLAQPAEPVVIAKRTIADEEHVFVLGLELGHEVVGRADLVVAHALHTTGNRAVMGDEQLAPARIHRGDDQSVGEAHREGEEIEARHTDHREAAGKRDGDRGRDTDAQPGVEARPDVDRHQADLVELDAGLTADRVDLWCQHLGVMPAAVRLHRREDSFVSADGTADLRARGFDSEDQHQVASPNRFASPS
jgi:hypothetical protein